MKVSWRDISFRRRNWVRSVWQVVLVLVLVLVLVRVLILIQEEIGCGLSGQVVRVWEGIRET